jgi:hypothetical protein
MHCCWQVWALVAKTLMALNMAIFFGQHYVQSVIFCLTTLSLVYLYLRYVSAAFPGTFVAKCLITCSLLAHNVGPPGSV